MASFKPNDSAFDVFCVLETNLNCAPSIVPSAVAISSYPGAVPISILPDVLEVGVIDVIVLNNPNVTTFLPEFGPEIVSVLLNPSVPIPTIVKEFHAHLQ